jgi:hypothetical protein
MAKKGKSRKQTKRQTTKRKPTPRTKSKSKTKPKNKSKSKSKPKNKSNSDDITFRPTQGKDPAPWYQFNFWDTLFDKHHIKHQYKGKGGDIFAQLVIFKQPENKVRGYIEFYIDGPITLNRLDSEDRKSVHRMIVGVEDRIVFKVDNSQINMVTLIDYEPKYQRDIKKDKKDKKFGVISMDRINDARDIFSWLQYSAEPIYFEDILERVEIEKGVVMKDKEKLKAVTVSDDDEDI